MKEHVIYLVLMAVFIVAWLIFAILAYACQSFLFLALSLSSLLVSIYYAIELDDTDKSGRKNR